MDSFRRSELCRALLAGLGIPDVVATEPIRIGPRSGVERVHLRDGSNRIFKFIIEGLSSENRVLASLAKQGIPVPRLDASAVSDGVLTMIMQDLGTHTDATPRDAAALAAQLHRIGPLHHNSPVSWLDYLNETVLADLPNRALHYLEVLARDDRVLADIDTLADLAALDAVAERRAAGAERAPWGICHGELRPSAVHINASGRRCLLDFAMAFNGPGLLDLVSWTASWTASWTDLHRPRDLEFSRQLIQDYVDLGGHRDALADRGGLTAERWALGWHYLHAATRRLGRAAAGIDGRDDDNSNGQILSDQIRDARQLLDL